MPIRQASKLIALIAVIVISCTHETNLLAQDPGQGWNIPDSNGSMNQPYPQVGSPEISSPIGHGNSMLPGNGSNVASPYSKYWASDQLWDWHILPGDTLYKAYLAGPRESRFSSVWNYDKDQGWLWDIALGGRAAILRYGSTGVTPAEGWELDIEGAVFPRLSLNEDRDLQSADFRFGVPLTFSSGPVAWKIGYYHISSHVGDEYWEKNPTFERRNYVRETLVLGGAYYPTDDWRLYGEFGHSFFNRGDSEPWEIQYGAEFSPAFDPGFYGAPFAAINSYHKQDRDWQPTLNSQLGWQWKSTETDNTFRVGLSYQTGPTVQYSFLTDNEDLLGIGIWYDY
jgi:hypothetical protein